MATSAGDRMRRSMGWGIAIPAGIGIVAVAAVLLVWIPDLFLTKLSGMGRSGRVTVATIWVFVFLVVFAWILRRLQARRVI